LGTFVVDAINENLREEHGYGDYELNRWTAVTFWFDEHRHAPLEQLLFGHGVGSTRDAEGAIVEAETLAQREYSGMGIGLTTVPAVLWELGVCGLIALAGILLSAFRAAGTLARVYDDVPWRAAVFQGLRASIAILAVSMFHKSSFVFHLPYQALLVCVLGYIAYWHPRSAAHLERKSTHATNVT
jgi:hypothetical protein